MNFNHVDDDHDDDEDDDGKDNDEHDHGDVDDDDHDVGGEGKCLRNQCHLGHGDVYCIFPAL